MWYVRIFPPLSRGCSSSVLSHRMRICARQRVWSGETHQRRIRLLLQMVLTAPNGFHGRSSIGFVERGIKRHAEFEASQPNFHWRQLSAAPGPSLGPTDLLHHRNHQLVQLPLHLLPQSDQAHHFINGRGIMSLEDFKRIIANLRSCFDVRIVSLHRDGEPLLNKHLEEYVSHLRDLGIYVTMSSNCSLISEERAQSLVAAGLRMVGTDFCAEPALYEKLRARGVWTETLAGIRNLLRAAVDARSDLRFVIKDMATHGRSVADGKALMEQTRALFSEWSDRVTVMAVYFHNALGESVVNLNAPAATTNGAE